MGWRYKVFQLIVRRKFSSIFDRNKEHRLPMLNRKLNIVITLVTAIVVVVVIIIPALDGGERYL